jgi:hypothetical protein
VDAEWPTRKAVAEQQEARGYRDSASYLDSAMDIPKGIVQGGMNVEMSLLDLAGKVSGVFSGNETPDAPHADFTRTGTGSLVAGVTQFLIPFVATEGLATAATGAVKAGKAAELIKGGESLAEFSTKAEAIAKASKLEKALTGLASGAVTDFTGFTGREGKLSDLANQHGLGNFITNALATDPNDNWAVARLKMAAEGLGIGTAFEGLFSAVRAVSGLKAGDKPAVESAVADMTKWVKESTRAEEIRSKVLSIVPDRITPEEADKTLLFSALMAKESGQTPEAFLSKLHDIRRSQDGLPPPGSLNQSESASIANESLQAFKKSSPDFTKAVQEGRDARISSMENEDANAALQRGDIPEPLIARAGQPPTPQPKEAGPDALPLADPSIQPYEVGGSTPKPDALPLEGGPRPPKLLDLADKPVRGFITTHDDLGAIIHLHASADASTFLHEMFHYAQLFGGLKPAHLQSLDAAFGSDPAGLEKAASAWERYLTDGIPPAPELEPAFKDVAQSMLNIYKSVNHPSIAAEVSPEVRAVFNQMLGFGGEAAVTGEAKAIPKPLVLSQSANIPADVRKAVTDAIHNGTDPVENGSAALQTVINRTHIDVQPGGNKILDAVHKGIDKFTFEARNGVQSNAETESLARGLIEDHGLTKEDALKFVGSLARKSSGLAERVLAARIYNNSFLEEARRLNLLSTSTPMNPGLRQQADEAIQNLIESMVQTNKTQTEVARTLQQFHINSTFVSLAEKEASSIIKKMRTAGPMELARLRRALATSDDLRSTTKALQWFDGAVDRVGGRTLSVINEWYINSLLGGLKTHITNLTSQMVQTLLLPGTRIAGGAMTGNMEAIRSGSRAYMNLVHSALDIFEWTDKGLKLNPDSSIGNAAKAWLKESPILDARTKIDDPQHAITAANLGVTNPYMAQGVDWLGKAVRLPTRLLTSADEFFKQLNYRAWLRDEAYQEASRLGLDSNPDEFARYVGQYIEDGFDELGRAKSDTALLKAKQATFTQDLVDGTLSKTISDAAAKHPILRLAIPFIKVPTNVLKAARDYTPGVDLMFKEFRDQFFSADKMTAADARGRLAVGTAFWTLTGGLAVSGKITGGGPKNFEQRSALMATGWRPYSFVVNNPDGTKTYYDFKRMEPFASLLGIAGDFSEVAGHLNDQTVSDAATAMSVALAKNLTNKTYVNSLAQVVDVLNNPEPSFKKFAQNFTGVMAVPGMVTNFNTDPNLREVQTYLDAIKARTPGFSKTLPPRRDLFGEPIQAPVGYADDTFRYSTRIGDPVKEELAKLEYGFSLPPKRLQGVDLTQIQNDKGQYAYDRLSQLQGEVKVGGKVLPDALSDLIHTDRYRSMPDPEGPQDSYNGKVKMVQAVIGRYRDAASRQLLKEFPQVRQMKQQLDQKKRDAQRPASNVLKLLDH